MRIEKILDISNTSAVRRLGRQTNGFLPCPPALLKRTGDPRSLAMLANHGLASDVVHFGRYSPKSGPVMLTLSFVEFDPFRPLAIIHVATAKLISATIKAPV